MKTLILSCVATAAFFTLSGCESDGEHDHDRQHGGRTTTTTTEETTVRHPVESATETRVIRSY